MTKLISLVILATLLSGCVSTISNTAGGGLEILPTPIKNQVRDDLIATAFNLDEAQRIGILPPESRAPACQHQINRALGVEPDPNAVAALSFMPMRDGLISEASIIYLEILRLRLQPSVIAIPQDCATVLGTIQIQVLGRALDIAGGIPVAVSP